MTFFFLALIFSTCKKCSKVGVVCKSIKANTCFLYVLNPKMWIPTTQEILLFRIVMFAIILFFGATYAITLFIDYFLVCQTYAVTLLELCLFETGKDSSWGDCTANCRLFAAKFVIFVVVFISYFWWYCIEAPLCTTTSMTVRHLFKSNLTWPTQLFNYFFPIIFYHVPPIFIDSESICFGATTLLRLDK